jgi:hypothetical protein
MRKMYNVKVQLEEMNGSTDMATMPEGGLLNVGIEGLDIVDAINALGSVFPKGTVFDVIAAEFEGSFENKEEVESGSHIQQLPPGEDVSAEEINEILNFEPLLGDDEKTESQDLDT